MDAEQSEQKKAKKFGFMKGAKMGKVIKSVVKSVSKAAKSVLTAGTDGVSSLLKGDIGGVADAAARAASMGTVSLGDKGVVNLNLTNQPKLETAPVTQTEAKAEGLQQYVSDARSRKNRRSRSSTNNTGGSMASDANKLSGTTALGV